MSKDANFEQFKGQGVKYAPKPAAPAPKPAEPFPEPAAPAGPSDEDRMRDTLMNERRLRRAQHREDQ